MLGRKPNTLLNPTRPAQAIITIALRGAYERPMKDEIRSGQVPRLARTRDSAGFARSGSIGSFTLWIETVENLYSRLRETKGVDRLDPFGLRHLRGCGGPQSPKSTHLTFAADVSSLLIPVGPD